MNVNLIKTRNPIRRIFTGTWYKVVNEKGEKLFCSTYTSFLLDDMSIEDWLNMLDEAEVEANIQLAYDRWNFGPGTEFDHKMLCLVQRKKEQDGYLLDPKLQIPMYNNSWRTPRGFLISIGVHVINWLALALMISIDLLCDHTPDWVEETVEKTLQKLLGKF